MHRVLRVFPTFALVAFATAASASNLVANRDFSHGFTAWTPLTSGVTLDETTGYPEAPSAHLVSGTSAAELASACIQTDSALIDLFMDVDAVAGSASVTFDFFSDNVCTASIGSAQSDSIPHGGGWTPRLVSDVAPPAGTQSLKFVLQANGGVSGSDVRFDHVELGDAGTVPDLVGMQEGMSGAWYDPTTSGQGFVISYAVLPVSPPVKNVFGAWYTFDTTAGGSDSQRWYTIQVVSGDEGGTVPVKIYQNVGGTFDAPPSTTAVEVGTGSLQFDSCLTGSFQYAFDDGRTGLIPLQRLMPNVECVETGTPTNPPSAFGFSGAWYDTATGGQGIVAEINPDNSQAFLGWFTYAADGILEDASGQRWLSAQGSFAPGSRTIDMLVYSTTGGTFDSTHGTVTTVQVGTATLTFTSCDSATLDYELTEGEWAGLAGSIPLTRLLPTPQSCVFGP